MSKGEILAMVTKNPTCQHRHIDNVRGCCKECGEEMVEKIYEADILKSAPNLAPGSGIYVPDHRQEKTVIIGFHITYRCKRCEFENKIILKRDCAPIWPCGVDHRGDYLDATSTRQQDGPFPPQDSSYRAQGVVGQGPDAPYI